MPPSDDLRAELQRRKKATSAVWALFQARPLVWLHWQRFAALSPCAWRTRISDARHKVKALGGGIEWNRSVTRSAYRYLPYQPLGRPADVPIPDRWPVSEAPTQEPWRLT